MDSKWNLKAKPTGLVTHQGDAGIGDIMIDRDHKEISQLLLDINFSAAETHPSRKSRIFRQLSQLMLSHFALEEGMMRATGYPNLDEHARRHGGIIAEIRALADEPHRQNRLLARLPAGLLWEAHVTHVEKEDQAFGLWLNEIPASSKHAR